ncbi:MAG: M28 family peptidase [Caulobacteraceae bacterium]
MATSFLALAAGAALAAPGAPSPPPAGPGPTNKACESRVNDTAAKLVECIQEEPLYDHLVAFQAISDRNPGPGGRGNRDPGQPGYEASVDYVAKLMRQAGYRVTIQSYEYADFAVAGVPTFDVAGRDYRFGDDWYVARLSGQGAPNARVRPVGGIVTDPAGNPRGGCSRTDFAGFVRGNIALIERGGCALDIKVANAEVAGAAGVILFNYPGASDRPNSRGAPGPGDAYPALLKSAASIPVVGVASYAVGADLDRLYLAGGAPAARLDIEVRSGPRKVDYNLIADSPFGDPNHVVVVDAHLDSIYGAGILDNASGSATIIEIALKLAKTSTRNQIRYIWFGGEEIGDLGSLYYTKTLSPPALKKIVFDIDSDVTATPNYDILVADPRFANDVARFPPNVVPQSERGNDYFYAYFKAKGLPSRPSPFGNDETDSNSFSLVGVPNTGILTQQDCCKSQKEVEIWGGFRGDYEGKVPGFHHACVDLPHRHCDNIDNISPYVMEFISKAFAHVTFDLANDASIDRGGK